MATYPYAWSPPNLRHPNDIKPSPPLLLPSLTNPHLQTPHRLALISEADLPSPSPSSPPGVGEECRTEHEFVLRQGAQKRPVLSLRCKSRAGRVGNKPVWFDGDCIEGGVQLMLHKQTHIEEVVFRVRGRIAPPETGRPDIFWSTAQQLYPPPSPNSPTSPSSNSNSPYSSTPAPALTRRPSLVGKKLRSQDVPAGNYYFPVGLHLPLQVRVGTRSLPLPPSFRKKNPSAVLEYEMMVTAYRGILREAYTLIVPFVFLPRSSPQFPLGRPHPTLGLGTLLIEAEETTSFDSANSADSAGSGESGSSGESTALPLTPLSTSPTASSPLSPMSPTTPWSPLSALSSLSAALTSSGTSSTPLTPHTPQLPHPSPLHLRLPEYTISLETQTRQIHGLAFAHRPCSLSVRLLLRAPLIYPRGWPVSCQVVLESGDQMVLDLFGADGAVTLGLEQKVTVNAEQATSELLQKGALRLRRPRHGSSSSSSMDPSSPMSPTSPGRFGSDFGGLGSVPGLGISSPVDTLSTTSRGLSRRPSLASGFSASAAASTAPVHTRVLEGTVLIPRETKPTFSFEGFVVEHVLALEFRPACFTTTNGKLIPKVCQSVQVVTDRVLAG